MTASRPANRARTSATAALTASMLLAAGVAVLTAGAATAAATPAAKSHTLDAYATGTGTAAGCPSNTVATAGCSFGAALSQAVGGDTIVLVTPASVATYKGNWVVSTTGTSPSKPLTITAPPGADPDDQPTLDGNDGKAAGCTTTSCSDSILAIGGASVTIDGVTFGNGSSADGPGAIRNGVSGTGGTLTVRNSVFVLNSGGVGGAIANGLNGGGVLKVDHSLFLFDQAQSGGAIANGLSAPVSAPVTATVTNSVFIGNNADSGGGAIRATGPVTTTVATSEFSGNSGSDGGAIGSFPSAGPSGKGGFTTTISASTFSKNGAEFGGAVSAEGAGSLAAVGSTFVGDTASTAGPEIAADGASVVLAADLVTGSCVRSETWLDDGHNAAVDSTCLNRGAGDLVDAKVGTELGQPAHNRSAYTETVAPTAASPVIGLVPNGATAPHAPSTVRQLCARTDQTGYRTATGSACDAGAIDLPAPLRPTLSIAGGASVAAGSTHVLTGRTRAGATVVLSQSGATPTMVTASGTGSYSITRTIRRTTTFTVTADRQTTRLVVTAVALTVGVTGRQPVRNGTHAVGGRAPARRVVTLIRDGRVIAHTTANSRNQYAFSLHLTATHRYRITCDGVASPVVGISVA